MHNCMHSTQMSTAQNMQTQDGSPTAPDHGNASIIRGLAQLNNHLSSILGSISIASCDGKDSGLTEYEAAVLEIRRLTKLMHIGATALQSGETNVLEDEQVCRLSDRNIGVVRGKLLDTPGEEESNIPCDQFLKSSQRPDHGSSTGQAAEDHVGDKTISLETVNQDLLSTTSNEISIKYVPSELSYCVAND
jgi:hypothetical protein